MRRFHRKWAVLIAGGALLQTATTGCPDGTALLGVASTAGQSLLTGVFGLYAKVWLNTLLGL